MDSTDQLAKVIRLPLRTPLTRQVTEILQEQESLRLLLREDYPGLGLQILTELARPVHTDP